MEELEIPNWCLDRQPNDTDWDYWDVEAINLNTLPPIKVNVAKFNQAASRKTAKACTIVNSVRSLLSLVEVWHWYQYDIAKEVDSAIDYCVANWGYTIWSGWSVPAAVNCVTKRWNINHPSMKVNYIKMDTYSDFYEILKRGYPMVW